MESGREQGGPVAVVTGGAQGIGRSICEGLVGRGHRVAILDLDGEGCRRTAEELGPRVVGYECDVTDVARLTQVKSEIEDRWGVCSKLVANVGWSPDKRFLDTSLSEQARIIDVNYVGSLNSSRVFLPGMTAQGTGRIVYISSDAARVGVAGEAIYAGAKAALLGFAKAVALEVARNGVTVNVVSPGSTNTPLLHQMFTAEQIEKRVKIHPMRRLAEPNDIAQAVLFFVSNDAAFITGQVLSVNGGMLRVG